ncbi:hypothetical protein [Erwinia tasmaniensis]|uniref:Uncharacterized protein n=1 Tax=Erwinia tasmaniensis (strain DSM 17950 / CFBP 7177 / CIP 109463 / NCPPB 4357 / Et1/99) TaxID=465817 RepID=B2VAR4_ERWT9|nr:hypothetical protein [Erwinia tasmaniensis]CAO94833.1 Hypothetical protein ETA_pET350330 [Erwinia tasmaniensis Et1/99]
MSEEENKITSVEIPSGLKPVPNLTGKDRDLIKMLKHRYIEKGIKITDDDPLIAIILGQDILLDIYAATLSEDLNSRLDSIMEGLNTFPVKVSEELTQKADAYLSMIEKIDNKSQEHLSGEFDNFAKRVSKYAKDTETHIRSLKVDERTPEPSLSGIKVFGLCFISSLISVSIALAVGYQLLTH